MKNKLFNISIIIICIFILTELLIMKDLIYSSIFYALNMWVNKLIPALFPFFIISDILINYNITLYIPKIIKKFCKWLWGITDNMLTILLLSLLSGFPSNARNTKTLYEKNLITSEEANHILIFSHFSNPVFILITVGYFFLNNQSVGIIILISHYLSNFILGIFYRNKFNHTEKLTRTINNNHNFGNILITSIKKSIDTILLICGIICVFFILSEIICKQFNLNIYNSMLIKGLSEITIGIESLSKLNLSLRYKTIIASCFLAFGGLSVHMQVISQITDTDIKYQYFFLGRIQQLIISGILSYILCIIFKI